ncbi:MAG: hypothetical protein ACFB02_17205 [Mastigocoleus sp.]
MSSKKSNQDHGEKKHHPLIESEAMVLCTYLLAMGKESPAVGNRISRKRRY